MKIILAVIPFLAVVVVGEPPASAPYPPSGWRPNGPAFDLPQRVGQNSKQRDSYLPPTDPRNPDTQYGAPDDEDVSVQGLPAGEPRPLFSESPVNGQQYVGSKFNTDIKTLNSNGQQQLYQRQQEIFRELARQRQLYNVSPNRQPDGSFNPQVPRQFVPTPTFSPSTTESTTVKDDTTSTTESEIDDDTRDKTNQQPQKQRVSVEVTKQNVQEFAPEILLAPLAQLTSQNRLAYQLQQLSQLRAPVIFQPNLGSQRQVAAPEANGYSGVAHLAALQSILSQRQSVVAQPQSVLPSQQGFVQPTNFVVPKTQGQLVPDNQQLYQYQQLQQPAQIVYNPQIQPALLQTQPQYQINELQYQPQPNIQYFGSNNNQEQKDLNNSGQNYDDKDGENDRNVNNNQQEFVIKQTATYQPQDVQYQQQFPVQQQEVQAQQVFLNQPQLQYQPQEPNQQNLFLQPQLLNYQPVGNQDLSQYYQNNPYLIQQQQFVQSQQQVDNQQNIPRGYQGQDNLQSGFDVNQQGNDIGDNEKKNDSDDSDSDQDNSNTAVAVATAFGARTSPRVFSQYGVPVPNARSNTGSQTTESTQNEESTTEDSDGATIAEATAVVRGGKRKSARLRSRRVRPIFTLDRTGHLVLANNE